MSDKLYYRFTAGLNLRRTLSSDCPRMNNTLLTRCCIRLAASLTMIASTVIAVADDSQLIAVIAESGPQGKGSAAAKSARDQLAKRSVELLPALLIAMDTPNPVAANWYRTIFEDIVAREQLRGDTEWPLQFLHEYVSDAQRRGRPRRLVLGLIDLLEPNFKTQWLPERLTDPEFRIEAVDLALAAGDKAVVEKDSETAQSQFRKAFESARDSSQVTSAADRLRSVGETADVARQLGFVTDWWLVGPLDAPDKSGFGMVFEPEKAIDLNAKFPGQNDAEIGWVRHQPSDPLGQVNLVTVLGQSNEAVAYAWSEITVPTGLNAQLRCSADDSCLVWLNNEIVSSHEQWLNGTRFDRFVDPITLVAGRNRILVKVCQGPQHRDPEVPNNWTLFLRLCDEEGRGIAFENALPPQRAKE